MKLAASQIAWPEEEQPQALDILKDRGFSGLEVAPGRVAGSEPYDDPARFAAFAKALRASCGLSVCSFQSIWFGRQGSIFGPERDFFLEYTKRAMLCAQAAGVGNLVFGCPKNRVLPAGTQAAAAIPFFKELGDFAHAHGTVLALEANPALYGTNFVNTTPEAFEMAAAVASPGFRVNLDFGTMLINGEALASLKGLVPRINHVHISEPELAMVEERGAHRELAALLRSAGYTGYVSLEMREQPLENLRRATAWLAEVFA
ncbi:MAG: sugar phosphate isomerase/epimerase family protein [Oscillospiraceae bacterium]